MWVTLVLSLFSINPRCQSPCFHDWDNVLYVLFVFGGKSGRAGAFLPLSPLETGLTSFQVSGLSNLQGYFLPMNLLVAV